MYDILVVDDDPKQLDMIEQLLDQEGYGVITAQTPREVLAIVDEDIPDLIVLDVGLPQMDGVTLCRRLRGNARLSETPIIFITGQNTPYSVADALDAGGDDFVRKPFALRELAARIRAQLRRSSRPTSVDMPTIRILPNAHRVMVNEREIELTRVEFDLLRFLCVAPDRWHSTQDLLSNVWQYPEGVGDAALVRNHVRNLRRKLEDNPDHPAIIQSRHGRGYVLRAEVEVGGPEPTPAP
jgi:DNA-binding response OmpR family regulator